MIRKKTKNHIDHSRR